MQDLRYAFRTLVKRPGYTAIVVATLALGIGGTTAMFSLVDGVLLKPLPYPEPDRLTLVFESIPAFRHPFILVDAGHFLRWTKEAESFESLALFTWDEETVTQLGYPTRIGVVKVWSTFFPTLGVTTRLGRSFLEEENEQGRGTSVIVTDRFWRRKLEADPDVLGREIVLNGRSYEIVGVLPSSFRFFEPSRISTFGTELASVDLFRPIEFDPKVVGQYNYAALGRLRRGVSAEQAEAELNVLQAAIGAELAQKIGQEVELKGLLKPLGETLLGNSRSGLFLAFGAVGLLLLIGCVNVANLALGRAGERQTEFATRAAVGASRARLFRQVLAESLSLAILGGVAGVVLALAIVAWFRSQGLIDLPRLEEIAIDVRTLVFAVAATTLSGLLFALIPAVKVSGAQPQRMLSGADRGGIGSAGARRLGEALAASEVALSAALLVVAGLLTHSLFEVLNRERGFETAGAATARISLPPAKYREPETRTAAMRSILDRINEIPGVEAAGVVTLLPLTRENNVIFVVAAEAGPLPVLEWPTANLRSASPRYFKAMGIRTLQGRVFREEESVERPVVISESVARRLWPGQDPVGREIRRENIKPPHLHVLGVVADVPVESLERDSTMVVYRPYWDRPRNSMALAVRSGRSPESLTPEVRRAIWAVDSQVPAVALEPVTELVTTSTADRRFQALLMLLFAGVALTLACLGVYGVLAHSVERRTNEIGLRMALGAKAPEVRRLVVRQGMRPVLWGLVVGVVSAVGISRVLESMLFEISPVDPLTLTVVPAVLLLAALAACSIPARRAAAVDPMTALRHE